MIFSIDTGIAFTIILTTTLIFALTLNVNAQLGEQQIKNFELEEKALLIADSLVKNHSPQNTLLGACIKDTDKKRVRTNELTSEEIKKAKSINFGKIFVKEVSYQTQTIKDKLTLSTKKTSECITVKRFVLIDGEKGIILIKTCREE